MGSKPVAGFNKHPEHINRKGPPVKEWTFRGLYIAELERLLTSNDGTTIAAKDAVAKRLIKMAVEGDIQAIKELSNRVDGLPANQPNILIQQNFGEQAKKVLDDLA